MTKVTLKDVAKEAGVGLSTASYVMNGTGLHKVGPQAQERIREAARKLHWQPNVLAQGLRKGKSSFIGVLVPAINYSFMPEILAGIDRTLASQGNSMVLCTYGSDEEFSSKLQVLMHKQIDGLLVKTWGTLAINTVQHLIGNHFPCVFVASRATGDYPAALVDPVCIGQCAARRLLTSRHRRIALCNVSLHPDGMSALLRELDEAGAPPPWILDADPQKALEMLFDNQNRFTAVIAQDIMAIRILQEALKRQIPVPESFSVLGIDGMDAGDYTVPRLTCVCQPQAEQGAAAAELLLEWLKSGHRPEGHLLLPSICERESIAEPRE